ncbi:MAG: 3-oxoacyl-ACP synthase [Legionella sp.]|nr:3-oxoacyl-ACP synthase [Legionella sp.]
MNNQARNIEPHTADPNRVFITGLSALTACGSNAETTWDTVISGQSALSEITQWDLSSWKYRLGGELQNFQPAKMLPDRKLLKAISRQDVMGINAATQAVELSGWLPYRDTLAPATLTTFNEETAIYVGSPGNKYYQQYDFLPLMSKTNNFQSFADGLFDEVHPMWLLRILPNNVLAYTGITYGFKGPNHNITNHAVGGTQALLEAYAAIQSGQAERAVVVAYDSLEPQSLFYYARLGVISERHLKPFDQSHDGTLLAEGAAAIVLESERSAKARSATCYAEMLGGGTASESAGLFSINQEGTQLAQLMNRTLERLNLKTKDIDCLIAHGNGNPRSDNTEAQAVNQLFPHRPPVSAFKWAMGHTLCSSGVVDAVLTTYALRTRCLPGIANLDKIANECASLNLSADQQSLPPASRAMMVSRGFASMNACLILQAVD